MKVSVSQAIFLLKQGAVVAVPTETVYGLAASFQNESAIEKIFTLKKRPRENPLIVHIANFEQLNFLVKKIPTRFEKLKSFWPGPLTVVFDAETQLIPAIVRAGLETVAIRMPDHKQTLEVISQTGPLVASSANFSRQSPAICAKQVEMNFGEKFTVLDGGSCKRGTASTIIRLKEESWECLREGAFSLAELERILGKKSFASL